MPYLNRLNSLEAKAYIENNELALDMYNEAISAIDKSIQSTKDKFIGEDKQGIVTLVNMTRWLLTEAVWVKRDWKTRQGYIIEGMDGDLHPTNHHIAVYNEGGGIWTVEIRFGQYGETELSYSVEGNFKKAQEEAINAAINMVLMKGEYLIYS